MNVLRRSCPFTALMAALVALLGFTLGARPANANPRERISLAAGWRFALGDDPAATTPGFDDRGWPAVVLPHDWSIESIPAADAPSGGHGGYFAGGVGWYRRALAVPAHWQGRRVNLVFDGAYRRAEVWLDGTRLGGHRYGYTPFRFDVTDHLRPGSTHALAVRIDHSAQPGTRWFTGAGLTRHVWLEVTEALHVAPESITITTSDLFPHAATLEVGLDVRSLTSNAAPLDPAAPGIRHAPSPATRTGTSDSVALTVDFSVIDPAGLPVARHRVPVSLSAGNTHRVVTRLAVPHPQPWAPATPRLYRLVTRLFTATTSEAPDARLADRVETTFGIRTIAVSAARGLELNGTPLKLVGANVHHDHGPLGGAAFDRAEERKVELLLAAGFNAVRTAHNPPAPAFLDACDRLGLLVIAEAFDGWAKKKVAHDYSEDFAGHWRADLAAMVRRDRHHPSVIFWSIGNEVYERGDASGLALTEAMAARVRSLDRSRPVTIGLNGLAKPEEWSRLDPLFAHLNVAGYNYELHRHAADHTRVPARVMFAAESYLSETFANWQAAHDHAYVLGDFVWTGVDYLGEAGIGRVFPPGEAVRRHWEGEHFPWHGAACGDLDLTGARRPGSHYRAIVWDRGEALFAAVRTPSPDGRPWGVTPWGLAPSRASWTWPGHEGQPLEVEVFSRHPAVRLYLDARLLGEQPTTRAQEFRAVFAVPYAPGTLRAVGVDAAGREAATFTLTTAGPPAQLRLTADRTTLRADGQDLAFVTVEVLDAEGRPAPDAAPAVTYTLTGPGTLAGIGSADLTSTESYRANPRRAHEGRALVIVRAGSGAAFAPAETLTLTAQAAGLAPATLTLHATP